MVKEIIFDEELSTCGKILLLVPEVPLASDKNQSGVTSPQPSLASADVSPRPSIVTRVVSILRFSITSTMSLATSSAMLADTWNWDQWLLKVAVPDTVCPDTTPTVSDRQTPRCETSTDDNQTDHNKTKSQTDAKS